MRANPQIIPQLLCEEYRVRQQYGDRPGLASYQPRFPAHFAEFQRLVEVCRGLGVHSPEDPYPVWPGPDGPVHVHRPRLPAVIAGPIPAMTQTE